VCDQALSNIPLPTGWPDSVRSAVTYVISLAHYAINDRNHNGHGSEHLHMAVRLNSAAEARRVDPRAWFRGYERRTTFGRQYASALAVIRHLAGSATTSQPANATSRPASPLLR